MSDWADEIASKVVSKLFPPSDPLYDPAWAEAPITIGEHSQNIAAALRKAKADGMREAATLCGTLAETTYDYQDAFEAACGCEAAIVKLANQTERGQQ